ncbi:MAG: recombinase family protein [Chloroflexi bacterium]|nr:recombinase family protein [Chloroflexota bacterium]
MSCLPPTLESSQEGTVGYFRVSTPGRVGEHHVPLEVQQAGFPHYCRAHFLQPVARFTDTASGGKDNRVQYQAVLRYIIGHRVGSVVALFLDRFRRN